MNRIIKAILYPFVRRRLAERIQYELNREHSLALGWYVLPTTREEMGAPRGECPDVSEQSLINRAWGREVW